MIRYRLHNITDFGVEIHDFYTENSLNNYIAVFVDPPYWVENLETNKSVYTGFTDIKPSTISKIITSGDINILIYIYEGLIYLYKISIPDEREISTAYKYNREFLCFIDTGIGDLKNISAVLQYETDRVTNLYLADGKHKIMIINVVDTDYIKSLRDANGKINIDYIS